MAEINIEKMGRKIAEEALDGYIYKGKTLREWIDILAQTQWIPVNERLPEKGKQVLCCNKQGSVFTSAITYINSNGMVAFGQHCDVIAWMPLPNPYESQESEV